MLFSIKNIIFNKFINWWNIGFLTIGAAFKGKNLAFPKIGATLKEKNLLPPGSKFFHLRVAPILEAMLERIFQDFSSVCKKKKKKKKKSHFC